MKLSLRFALESLFVTGAAENVAHRREATGSPAAVTAGSPDGSQAAVSRAACAAPRYRPAA